MAFQEKALIKQLSHLGGLGLAKRRALRKLKVISYSSTFKDFIFKNNYKLKFFLNHVKEDFANYEKRLVKVKAMPLASLSVNDFRKELRDVKNREMINIFVNDALGYDDFALTVKKISFLAEITTGLAFKYCGLDDFLNVIAMGKLGGEELNYSSDIDLFFILNEDVILPSKEILKRIRSFIGIMHNLDENGFVFKIDLAIRPEGSSGFLYSKFNSFCNYFKNRAKEWEFQALIKSRWLLGSEKIKNQFEDFKKEIIYNEKNFKSKKYLENIRRMKLRIEENIKLNEKGYTLSKGFNLKLASGGIRDIEFFIQFLQLQHGLFSPSLNTTNTLKALEKLKMLKVIEESEAKKLANNYVFLRRLEHYLQIEAFVAVRNFPTSLEGKERLVAILNSNPKNHYKVTTLEARLERVVEENQTIFYKLFHLTLNFISKIENVIEKIGRQERQIEQLKGFESDYFIHFSEKAIFNHLNLFSSLEVNQKKIAAVEFKKRDQYYLLDIVTFDVLEAFPVICGIVSTFGLSIIAGTSYLYTPIKNRDWLVEKQKISFPLIKLIKNYNYPKTKTIKDIKNRKIICSLECLFISPSFKKKFVLESFVKKVNDYFHLLKTKKNQIVLERIFLETLEFNRYKKNLGYFKPIFIDIDNGFHPFYTVLNIRSEDSFLFLFQFTKSFIFQEIYIVKVKIKTLKNEIKNTFYLTHHNGEKITDKDKIWQLKNILHFIMYFSFYLFKAPNPFLALTQFTKMINLFKEDYPKLMTNFFSDSGVLSELAKVLGTRENIFENFFSLNYASLKALNLSKNQELDFKSDYKKFKKKNKNLAENKILNDYKDKTLFNLDMNFLSKGGGKKFEEFCFNLSNLADFVIKKAFKIAWDKAKELPHFSSIKRFNFVILGLGKWGGQELGYASDIEMLFVYQRNEKKIDSDLLRRFCERVLQEIKNIIKANRDGIFEIDFNLRPEGSSSTNFSVAWKKFKNYYSFTSRHFSKAINFERMSLVKARVISFSHKSLVQKIEKAISDFIYDPRELDFEEMEHLRQKQIKQWVPPHKINLKFSRGGLVDIEYLVICFNIIHGRSNPKVRHANTLKSLSLLRKYDCIDKDTFFELKNSYVFLRNIINALRSVRGNAKDLILPDKDSLEMEYLSRRLKDFDIIAKPLNLFTEIVAKMEKTAHLVRSFLSRI